MIYECCNNEMLTLGAYRDFDIKVELTWCTICGRALKITTCGSIIDTKAYTPIDNYKGCNRECL
jgi:hypothetical protein